MSKQPKTSHVVIPQEYAGLWIAWDSKETKIIASGRTLEEARQAAQRAGEQEPVLEKVPRADVRFVGSAT
jgi:hypothetical protein